MKFDKVTPDPKGQVIDVTQTGEVRTPDFPIIPFIEGDGVGADIWRAARPVFEAAVEKAFSGKRKVSWFEVFAGEKAQSAYNELIPEDTLNAIRHYHVAIKGPLMTPVGGGFRSLNVTLRQIFDLYACVRPVKYFEGVPAPVKHPEKIDTVVFRENTEDVYAGIEWRAGTPENQKLTDFLKRELGAEIREGSGIGIKPISLVGSKRLIRKAIEYALQNGKRSVTLVHKGNIQKYTEGAFRDWGYELAREEFTNQTVTEKEVWEKHQGRLPEGKILIRDRIADAMFLELLMRPEQYEVIATTNLNGDYLSDALVAQVGGLGLAPGANLGTHHAIFEATHGTAPTIAGQDKANPGSLILSGALMFEFLGWPEVARIIVSSLGSTIRQGRVTEDLSQEMEASTRLSCSEFGQAVVENIKEELE